MDLLQKIKESDDVGKKIVHVEEWDCDVEVRSFTAWVRGELLEKARLPDGELDNRMLNELLLVQSTFDPETGKKLFCKDDLEWLREKSGPAIDNIVSEIIIINKMSQKNVDEEAKN